MLGRAALRGPRLLGSTARTALPVLATVQQLQSFSSITSSALPALAVSPINVKQQFSPTDITPTTPAAAPAAVAMDELEKYLELPVEKNMDLKVLEWWKAKDCAPKDGGLPALAKMARQFLGRPASSAGVERMFSKAG